MGEVDPFRNDSDPRGIQAVCLDGNSSAVFAGHHHYIGRSSVGTLEAREEAESQPGPAALEAKLVGHHPLQAHDVARAPGPKREPVQVEAYDEGRIGQLGVARTGQRQVVADSPKGIDPIGERPDVMDGMPERLQPFSQAGDRHSRATAQMWLDGPGIEKGDAQTAIPTARLSLRPGRSRSP